MSANHSGFYGQHAAFREHRLRARLGTQATSGRDCVRACDHSLNRERPTHAALHQEFCGLAGPTDVLTFRHGEIVISAETAARQAKMFRSSLTGEIRLYLLHGLLHLAGFNDVAPRQRKQMLQLQRKLFFPCVRTAEVGLARTGRQRCLSIVLLLAPRLQAGASPQKWTRGVLTACGQCRCIRRWLALVEMSKAVETAFFAIVLCVHRPKGRC